MVDLSELFDGKPRRGRPRGPGNLGDEAVLTSVADFKVRYPHAPTFTVIKRVLRQGVTTARTSTPRHLYAKWKKRQRVLLAEARERRRWKTLRDQCNELVRREREMRAIWPYGDALGRAAREYEASSAARLLQEYEASSVRRLLRGY